MIDTDPGALAHLAFDEDTGQFKTGVFARYNKYLIRIQVILKSQPSHLLLQESLVKVYESLWHWMPVTQNQSIQ